MLVELRPDKKLIDAKFNGYKLSLDPIPVYHQSITKGVDHVTQSEDQYSFVHAKVFSLHNHLFRDPWQDNTVYLVDKDWNVLKATVNSETCTLAELKVVWTIPHLNQRIPGNFNCGLLFPNQKSAVVADGCGRLHLLNREDVGEWKLELSYEAAGCESGSVLMAVRLDADCNLHCVLMTLETVSTEQEPVSHSPSSNKPKPATTNTVLYWVTFTRDADKGVWKELCLRRLEGPGSVDYVDLEASCSALYVASNTKFNFTADSVSPLPPPEEKSDEAKYTWEQTVEDVKVVVAVEAGVTRDNVEVKVSESEVTICCQQLTIVSGPLSHPVDTDLTTWTFQPQRLEVTLVKKDTGLMWSELVPGDKGGKQLVDPAVVEDVHSRLSHLCSDTEVQESGENYAPTFNLDQLEECDSAPEESCSLLRLSATSHSISHQISLTGHQWLMSVTQEPDQPSCICVRHDVDGCVWQLGSPLDPSDWPCQHVGTFSALGYVIASKQQKKFVLAAPDLSYAVICEASNHVFVYYKSCSVSGELRNRKTSSTVTSVAKQQLINLNSQSTVLGAQATASYLFVLTTDTLYMYHIMQ